MAHRKVGSLGLAIPPLRRLNSAYGVNLERGPSWVKAPLHKHLHSRKKRFAPNLLSSISLTTRCGVRLNREETTSTSPRDSISLQKEKVRPQLTLLYQLDDTLWSEIESRGDVEVVSSRPTRIPLELLAGGTFTTNTPDGGDLGLGSAPITDFMTLVPTYFFQCSQWTKQAEISTNANEKAIEDYSKLVMKRAMKNFRTYMEAVFTQGAGDNMLDTASATAALGANVIYVHNANQFQDQQPIDVWTATGGTYVTTFVIQSVDAANKALWLAAPLAAQVTSGYGLYVKGSAGVANSGLFGLFQAAVSSNSGTCFGLSRASYPGKLTMPYVNGNNQPITPSTARKLTGQMQIALGATAAFELDLQINMGPDQMT